VPSYFPKTAPYPGGPLHPYDGSTIPDGIWIESAIFVQYTLVTNGQTDAQNDNRTGPVPTGCLGYVCVTQPKNKCFIHFKDLTKDKNISQKC